MQTDGFLGDGEIIRGSNVAAVQTLTGLTASWASRGLTNDARVNDHMIGLLEDLCDFEGGWEESDFHCQALAF